MACTSVGSYLRHSIALHADVDLRHPVIWQVGLHSGLPGENKVTMLCPRRRYCKIAGAKWSGAETDRATVCRNARCRTTLGLESGRSGTSTHIACLLGSLVANHNVSKRKLQQAMLPKIAHRAFETPPATLLYLELRQITYACFKSTLQLYLY